VKDGKSRVRASADYRLQLASEMLQTGSSNKPYFPGRKSMPINELLVREFQRDLDRTKDTLKRVPKDKWDWKPHEKSGTLGWMAGHVATLPGFTFMVSTKPELDVANPESHPPKVDKDADLVDLHGKLGNQACEALTKLSDDQLNQPWSLKYGGQVLFTMPLYDALRGMCFNHIIHHRGQLTMYLRALNVPVPALYGPSADENPFR
jgi:uncharacterized damage-inducible protein DinB